jgi:hypothetical protein
MKTLLKNSKSTTKSQRFIKSDPDVAFWDSYLESASGKKMILKSLVSPVLKVSKDTFFKKLKKKLSLG